MPSRTTDEREQRRGLVLGLTLAEILLLLLFLLLLVLGSQIRTWRDRYEQLDQSLEEIKPLQQALMDGGAVDVNGVHELVARLQNLQKTEQELSKLKTENADLAKQSELLKSLGLGSDDKLRNVAGAVKRASEIDPNDPPALLKRALDVIDRLGASTQPGQVKPLSEMVAGPELEQKLAALETERDQLRRERNNLMRGPGNGLTYPSCWTTSAGQTEYIFDVTFADTGLQVRNASPPRANDKAWDLVGQFARETMIDERIFISATKKLFEWSKGQNCRFYAIVRDATGNNKARYKHLQEMVQGNFYPFYPSPQRRARERMAAPTSTPDEVSSSPNPVLQAIH
jgi:cell division protein FtsB